MDLYKDGLIELRYDVASDILKVSWPDTERSSVGELQYSIQKLLDHIRHYDIRRLLIDARRNVVTATDDEYRNMNDQFAQELLSTRLKKIARMGSANTNREKITKEIATEKLKEKNEVEFREFGDEESAMAWLRE